LFLTIVRFFLHSFPRPASWIYGGILVTGGQGRKERKMGRRGGNMRGERREKGWNEREVDPFQHLPRSLRT